MKTQDFLFTTVMASTVSWTMQVTPMTLLASTFNQTYSCHTPLIIEDSITIVLDEDILISGDDVCTPIVASPFLNLRGTITFVSTHNHAVVIGAGTVWDLRSFSRATQAIIFSGNATLIMNPGGGIALNQAKFLFTQNSVWTFIPATIADQG
jgi:hypothetical protein